MKVTKEMKDSVRMAKDFAEVLAKPIANCIVECVPAAIGNCIDKGLAKMKQDHIDGHKKELRALVEEYKTLRWFNVFRKTTISVQINDLQDHLFELEETK